MSTSKGSKPYALMVQGTTSDAGKTVLESWSRLEQQYEAIIVEGAGSPAEINRFRGDLAWITENSWDKAIERHLRYGGKVLGICGGYQMLGKTISDPDGCISPDGQIAGSYLHGLFDQPHAAQDLLRWAGLEKPAGIDRAELREREIDRLTDCLEQHLDMATLFPQWCAD